MSTSTDERVLGLPTDLEEGNSGNEDKPSIAQTAIPKDKLLRDSRGLPVDERGWPVMEVVDYPTTQDTASASAQTTTVPDHSPASLPESRLTAEEVTQPSYLWIASPYVMPRLVNAYPLALRELGAGFFITEKEAINRARQFRVDHIDILQKEVNLLDERFDAIEDREMAQEKRRINDPD